MVRAMSRAKRIELITEIMVIAAKWNLALGPVILLVGAAAAVVGASVAWEVSSVLLFAVPCALIYM